MAEPEVATKAPENDAEEVSGIVGDSKPNQGAASMGVGHFKVDKARRNRN